MAPSQQLESLSPFRSLQTSELLSVDVECQTYHPFAGDNNNNNRIFKVGTIIDKGVS